MSEHDQEPTVVEPVDAELVEPLEATVVAPIEDAEVVEDVAATEPVLISSQLAPKLTLDEAEPYLAKAQSTD